MKMKKRLFGILLSLALMLGVMPGLSLTAYADGTTYNPASTYTGFGNLNTNDTEVTISEVSGKTWYVIGNDTSTVTLLSKQSFGSQAFSSSGTNAYANSEIKTYVEGLKGEGQPLAGISSVISDLTLIDKGTASVLSEIKRKGGGTNWWLCSPGSSGNYAAYVYGMSGDVYNSGLVSGAFGVRPALKLNLSKVAFDSATNTFSLATLYPLWVGGTQVTSAQSSGQEWEYDDTTKTLALNGYNYSGEGHNNAGIYAEQDLTILVTGENNITSTTDTGIGISVTGNLKIEGSGSLTVSGQDHDIYISNGLTVNGGTVNCNSRGILAGMNSAVTINNGTVITDGGEMCRGIEAVNVTVNGGTVEANGTSGIESEYIEVTGGEVIANGENRGLSSSGDLIISGGTVTAIGTANATPIVGIVSEYGSVTITDGTVSAKGSKNGIWAKDGVTINGGATTAIGGTKAIYGTLKNAIAGTGWTDTAGAEGKANIAISTEGQELPYMKVQFPGLPVASVTTAPASKGLTYTGSEQELVTAGTASGGTMNYALGKDATNTPTEGWSTSIPTATEAGTYYVWYKAVGDDSHTDSEAAYVTSKIRAKISATVTFKVTKGSWDDGTTADKSVTLNGFEGDTLKLSADQIPAVGNKPDAEYQAGSWDTVPSTDAAVTGNKTFTYTYSPKGTISRTVTFYVVNGSWDDGTAESKSVTLTGKEGDTLKLSADQIPAVGSKPNEGYQAGSWNVVPDTTNAITADTAYTYTYEKMDPVTPEDDKDDKDGKDGPVITTDLKLGSQGTEVQALQQRLSALGYYNGAIDGDFGRVTDAAVKAFQRANGLYVDGVVGPLTRQALGYTAPSSGKGTAPSSNGSLVLGSTGEAVLSLQQTLRSQGYNVGALDGYFGPVTETAVKAFQRANGLYVDGVVGPYTWAALRGGSAYVAPAEEAVAPQTAPNNGDLVYGMTSDEIAYIQLILNLLGYDVGVIDGYFGDVTLEAVKAFQRDFGLYVDGIIGAQTKAALGIQ